MFLNYLFIGFFVVGIATGLISAALQGNAGVLTDMVQATFSSATNAFEIALALTGVLCFWTGLINIAKESGVTERLSRAVGPTLGALFPSVPKGHPAMSHIFMNVSANILGLDNAATPIGLKAMEELQTLNPHKERASNAQIMFIVLNASGLTVIPTSIMAYRMQAGAANPADVFLPILLATLLSTLTAVLLVGLRQRINLLQRPLVKLWIGLALFLGVVFCGFKFLPQETFRTVSSVVSAVTLLGIIAYFMISGLRRRINVYNAFIDGAKEGFGTAVSIIPYLVAILVAVGVFRASGAMQWLIDGMRYCVGAMGLENGWVEALPTMLMKPLSGSGARGMMVDVMNTYGADSLVGRIACSAQGSTDTTLYVVALYFGAVKIARTRYTVGYSLIADLVGLVSCIPICYLFFAA